MYTTTTRTTVEIRLRDGMYEVYQDVFEGNPALAAYFRKVKSSRDLNKAKKYALKLADRVAFGQHTFYRD